MKKLKIIISGGGTGGHVFPAIAIADAIKAKRPDTEFLFVGAKGKIETEKVPAAGYNIEVLNISGFHRKSLRRNLTFGFKLAQSLWRAAKIIRTYEPDAVVGVGGYASGPVLEMAGRKGIPTLVQEQNSYPGVTNKLLAKKAKKICVAYKGMDRFFPAAKIQLTGNPVREDIRRSTATRDEGLRHFGLDPAKQTVVVTGGSLGARSINEAMAANADSIRNNPQVQILWQAGKLYIEKFSQSETAQCENVKISQFIDRMDLAYAAADVVIGRAGALTISELCLVGKPAILIPSPNVAEDHQTKNALALTRENAAVLVKDKEAKELIIRSALEILGDEKRAKELSNNILQAGKPDAAAEIADAVLALADADTVV